MSGSGSGYVGRHEPDILFAADPWFRGIDLSYGPDGGVFVLDWSDTGECHEHDGVHRESGRIFKITHGEPARVAIGDISRLDEPGLVALHRHANEWFVRQARLVLAERSARGEPLAVAKSIASEASSTKTRTRPGRSAPSRSLYVIGGADRAFLRSLLHHEQESVRAWAIRLLTDDMPLDTIFSQRIGPDRTNWPPTSRTSSQTLLAPTSRAWCDWSWPQPFSEWQRRSAVALARALVSRAEDASDHNLPSLIWTALIPVADVDPSSLVASGGSLPASGSGPLDCPSIGGRDRDAARSHQRAARGRRQQAGSIPVPSALGSRRGAGRLA